MAVESQRPQSNISKMYCFSDFGAKVKITFNARITKNLMLQ
jgi:hypothetical protein